MSDGFEAKILASSQGAASVLDGDGLVDSDTFDHGLGSLDGGGD